MEEPLEDGYRTSFMTIDVNKQLNSKFPTDILAMIYYHIRISPVFDALLSLSEGHSFSMVCC